MALQSPAPSLAMRTQMPAPVTSLPLPCISLPPLARGTGASTRSDTACVTLATKGTRAAVSRCRALCPPSLCGCNLCCSPLSVTILHTQSKTSSHLPFPPLWFLSASTVTTLHTMVGTHNPATWVSRRKAVHWSSAPPASGTSWLKLRSHL